MGVVIIVYQYCWGVGMPQVAMYRICIVFQQLHPTDTTPQSRKSAHQHSYPQLLTRPAFCELCIFCAILCNICTMYYLKDACMKHITIEFKFNTISFLNLSISNVKIFKLTLAQLTYLRRLFHHNSILNHRYTQSFRHCYCRQKYRYNLRCLLHTR